MTIDLSRLRGQWVECWYHSESKTRVIVWRSWWKSKKRKFASASELRRGWVCSGRTWRPLQTPYHAIAPQSPYMSQGQLKALKQAMTAIAPGQQTVMVGGPGVEFRDTEEMGYARRDRVRD